MDPTPTHLIQKMELVFKRPLPVSLFPVCLSFLDWSCCKQLIVSEGRTCSFRQAVTFLFLLFKNVFSETVELKTGFYFIFCWLLGWIFHQWFPECFCFVCRSLKVFSWHHHHHHLSTFLMFFLSYTEDFAHCLRVLPSDM